MIQLGLSIMAKNPPETMGELQKLLSLFEAKTRIHVNVTIFPWSTAWTAISRYATYGSGPDVSEVGTSWMGDLIEKNVLANFNSSDIARLGGEMNFYPQVWQTCSVVGDETVWAVPWITETRSIFYRRDYFDKIDIDPATAFISAAALDQTLARLQASGINQPWAVTSRRAMNTLHYMCSWVWGAGGDYFMPDGKTLAIHSPEAIDGMVAYYGLKQYLGPFASRMSDLLATTTFWGGQSAVTIDGQWALSVQRRTSSPDVIKNVEVAQVPGVPYVGGSNLVIWKNCKEPNAALELVNFLNSPEVVLTFQKYAGHLPGRKDIFRSFISQQTDPIYKVFEEALQNGRSFPIVPHWGRFENKMVEILGLIWEDWLNISAGNLRDIVIRRIKQLEESVETGLY
jgi:multiple sugar transport system substrate-binding protein